MRTLPLLGAWVVLVARTALALPVGPEFQVNTDTAGDQGYPAACIDDAGDATVAWESLGADGTSAVRTRRFDDAGAPLGEEATLDTFTGGLAQAQAIACAPDRGYLVAWERRDGDDFDIAARRVGADGTASPPLAINTTTTDRQREPATCSDAAGNFVVVWQSYDQDGDGYGIFARRFDSSGAARGSELSGQHLHRLFAGAPRRGVQRRRRLRRRVGRRRAGRRRLRHLRPAYRSSTAPRPVPSSASTVTPPARSNGRSSPPRPAATSSSCGRATTTRTATSYGVFGKRFSAAGAAQGSEFQVNAVYAVQPAEARARVGANGDFTVAWSSPDAGDGSDVFARHFNCRRRSGRHQQFRVNTSHRRRPRAPLADEGHVVSVGRGSNGTFLIAWQSTGIGIPIRRMAMAPASSRNASPAPRPAVRATATAAAASAMNELVTGVGIALGSRPLDDCRAFERNGTARYRLPSWSPRSTRR